MPGNIELVPMGGMQLVDEWCWIPFGRGVLAVRVVLVTGKVVRVSYYLYRMPGYAFRVPGYIHEVSRCVVGLVPGKVVGVPGRVVAGPGSVGVILFQNVPDQCCSNDAFPQLS